MSKGKKTTTHKQSIPLERMNGPTHTSGATTVTLSTAMALPQQDQSPLSTT